MEQLLITVVQGDQGFDINFTLTDAAGTAINLVGATLTFKGQLLSDPEVQFSGGMSITNASTGKCAYTVAATDFEIAGTYNCQIIVNFPTADETFRFADIQIVAEPSVPIPN